MIKIKEILNPINALALGNSFKDEYCFYKYKQDDFTNIKTEKENLLILIMSYRFNLIDMSYLLDINPNDLELLNYYNTVKKDFYNQAKEKMISEDILNGIMDHITIR